MKYRKYFEFFNTREWCKIIFQVTNQTTVKGKYKKCYDLTVLINGFPVVQVELKLRGLNFNESFTSKVALTLKAKPTYFD